MEIRKISYFVGILLVGILMLGVVMGAGYTVSVPSSSNGNTGGTGGFMGTSNNTAEEDNETVSDDDEDGDGGGVSKGIENVTKFVKNIGWRSVVLVLVSLGVIVGAVWYFLVDKRKGFVEIRVKGKGKKK